MDSAFHFVIPLLALATLGILVTGIAGMLRGGEFNRKHGNKLMQLRVLFQAATVLLIGIALLFASR